MRAGHWAGKIKRAIGKDGLHDKGWDKFKNWVSDHARLLNDLANVLVRVATACAIVALFIPGLNILAMIALGAPLGSLLLHTATAPAGAGKLDRRRARRLRPGHLRARAAGDAGDAVPDLRKPPIPVFVGFWEPQHDYGSAALYYSGAFEENKAVGKTPIREEFSTDHLSDGIRVIRFVPLSADDPQAPDHPQDPLAPQDPDPVLGVLAYHWRTKSPVVDVQLLAFTHELGRLYAALPDFDAFARTIALTATSVPE